MTNRKVFVSYDLEGDMLEVLWAFREGYFTPTDDERILKRLDDDGEVIGFLIHEMSTLKEPSSLEFELESPPPRRGRRHRDGARGGRPVGRVRTQCAQVGPGRPCARSNKDGSRVANSNAGRGDAGQARSRGCRWPCCCRRGVDTHPPQDTLMQGVAVHLHQWSANRHTEVSCTSGIHQPSADSPECVRLPNLAPYMRKVVN